MRKQYLILETSNLPPEPVPEAVGDPRLVQAAALVAGAGRPRPPRVPRIEDDRFIHYEGMRIVICFSMPEAEEWIDEQLAHHPNHKYIIFESVAFLETVASPTIRKMWDANGQLREKE
jgi:hypothetical protein